MTRNAFLAAFLAMALASGVSRAATFAPYSPAPAVDNAGDFRGVSSLGRITDVEVNLASDGEAFTFAGDVAIGNPSPAAQTEAWALVPEPAAWTVLLLGLGGVGASLRARRRLLLGRAHPRIGGRR